MQLEKINGNTYFIPAPTNIGVFQFRDKYTLLIDTGDNNQQARKINEVLQENGLAVKYIFLTHNHIDHSGGVAFFRDHFPGSLFYTSVAESLYLETRLLFALYLFGGNPPRELSRHFSSKDHQIDQTVAPGVLRLNDERFEIVPLAGHAAGQIGIGTRDRVCFLGDALFSQEIIAKYSFPFLFNIEQQLTTYQTITKLADYDYFVLGHAEKVYTRSEIVQLAAFNQEKLNYFLDMILEILVQPHTREELVEEIFILEELETDFKEYYFTLSTTAAMIAYLLDKMLINYQLENGKLYFYKD